MAVTAPLITANVAHDVLDLIGNTPMADISALSPNPNVNIYAKLEGQNPGGSVKDRIARAMVLAAEADSTLRPGKTIIEPSSGNTGIALAMIARMRGYPITIVMPENVSPERRQMLEIYGAKIIFTPGSEGSNGAVRRAQELADENPEWVFLYQYANMANPQAHYDTTGPEILADVPEITHFVAGLGTSGTLMGVGHFLKDNKPSVKVLAIEPPIGEMVDGLRNIEDGYVPPVYEKWGGVDLLDGKRIVRPRESVEYVRRLADLGIFAGISAGAAVAGAARAAEKIDEGTIVVIVADGGWKYLSTGAWTDDLDDVVDRTKEIIYF
jgi:cysteine synthase